MTRKSEKFTTIPATKVERDALYGSSPTISDDIISELNIRFKGYRFLNFSIKQAQKMALDALREFGSEKAYAIPATPEMIDAGDCGFRLKES